jgi:hypothetical protein
MRRDRAMGDERRPTDPRAFVTKSEPDRRDGRLRENGADIAVTITAVGRLIGAPEHIIEECVADLPVQELNNSPQGAA